jgi:dTDP-4-amino-4,6-dideoxygalactose transaminase
MSLMRNFGHNGPEKFDGIGINGKNSEFHAAMGLVNLDYVGFILKERREAVEFYCDHLDSCQVKLPPIDMLEWNCSYMPVVFDSEKSAIQVKGRLEANAIFPRRYFYPSLDTIFDPGMEHCANSLSTAKSILCLPLFNGISEKEMTLVMNEILHK